RDPRANLFLFIALSGALIVVPVYLGTRALFGDTRAALFAALVVMCMPAHVDRTLAQHVRFDAPGITLCALHAAFALRALATPARAAGPARLALVAGAVALALAAGRWLAPPGAYGSILGALLARFRVWLDPNAPLTPGERLRLDVSELAGMSPLRFLIGIKDFFLVGPWCLIAPL